MARCLDPISERGRLGTRLGKVTSFWLLAESLAGKDRYEFEKFFAPRTVLTLSESVFRYIDTRQRIPV